MKVILPLADGFEEIEVTTIADVLRRAGIDTVLAGISSTIVEGKTGTKIVADGRFGDYKTKDFSAIVLPGGPGYEILNKSSKVRKLTREFHEEGKYVGAICAAPKILSDMGILANKRATIYPGMEKGLPHPRNGPVVVDGNIITSEGPGTALDFSLKLVEKIKGKKQADRLREELVYG